jgi:hypothetical protein
MKTLWLSMLAIGFIACNTSDKKNSSTGDEQSKQARNYETALQKLDKTQMSNLTVAVETFQKEIKNEKDGDLALPTLLQYITTSLDTLNDVMGANSAEYAAMVTDSIKTPSAKQLSLARDMMAHHTQLQSDGEGGIYLGYDYTWLSKAIGDKVSAPVRTYLQVTSTEASTPFSTDAAIVIPPQALADRALITEQLSTQTLPSALAQDVSRVNKVYTNALLFGTDNTPSLQAGTNRWVPAFQQVYQYVQTKSPNSALAKKINEWQSVVASGNRQQINEYIQANWK